MCIPNILVPLSKLALRVCRVHGCASARVCVVGCDYCWCPRDPFLLHEMLYSVHICTRRTCACLDAGSLLLYMHKCGFAGSTAAFCASALHTSQDVVWRHCQCVANWGCQSIAQSLIPVPHTMHEPTCMWAMAARRLVLAVACCCFAVAQHC